MLDQLMGFIADHPGQKKIIVETIEFFQKINYDYLNNCCQICDKKLDNLELRLLAPTDFTHTCLKHQQYRNVFQADMIRERLGIPLRRFNTDEDLQNLLSNTALT